MYVGKVPNILKTCRGNELNLFTSLTWVPDEGCPQLNASAKLYPQRKPTHPLRIEDWMVPEFFLTVILLPAWN
jgi:hypothetical protein